MDKSTEIKKMLDELDEIEEQISTANDDSISDIIDAKDYLDKMQEDMDKSSIRAEDIKRLENRLRNIESKLDDVESLKSDVKYLRSVIDDKLSVDFNAMYENVMEHMDVEAIKIYRNLQAVIVEENAKQNQVLFGIDGKSSSLKKRLNNVMIFSIISFVVSILVMLMQILPALGVDLF